MKYFKAITACLLVAAMMFLMSVPAFAAEATDEIEGKYAEVFKRVVEETDSLRYDMILEYKDCYEYYSESNNTDTPDWALFYGYCGYPDNPDLLSGAYVYTVCGDYFLERYTVMSSPYPMAYYVYVPQEDKCYNLNEAFDAELENIDYTFTKYILENEPHRSRTIGDVDRDGKLTVMDATLIQKRVAQSQDFSYTNIMVVDTDSVALPTVKPIKNTADIDRDGEITIKDATAIQKKVAQLG